MNETIDKVLCARIQSVLTPDLLKPEYKNHTRPYAGHCYVASEVYYHLLGGKSAGLTPYSIRHEGAVHWFLRNAQGVVIDITADQFETPVPYEQGRGTGFLTRRPSKRAQEVIRRLQDG